MISSSSDICSGRRASITAAIVAWLDRHSIDELWTTTITIFEIKFGLDLLPAGAWRRSLQAAFNLFVEEDLDDRILTFDAAAASRAGALAARRRTRGRPMEIRDAQIAGIVAENDATLSTRNLRDFDGLGISLVDPWTDAPT